ncbi:MAG: hypothetical protein ACRBFS_03570 [Aureispira sp.]
MRLLLYSLTIVFLLLSSTSAKAQILNADRYEVSTDSLRPFKAIIDIGFSINKQSSLIFSLNNRLDLSYNKGQNLWVLVGQFKLFRSGSKNLLHGGFAHARSRFFKKHWVHPECFAQYQLDGIRGMNLRFLVGSNARFTIKEYEDGRFHLGLGAMYEFEHWNYSGVPTDRLPLSTPLVSNHFIKINSYLSLTQTFQKILLLQITAYVQFRPDSFIRYPRLFADGRLGITLSKHVQFTIQYHLFYDSLPVVPIDRLYFSIINKLTFTF